MGEQNNHNETINGFVVGTYFVGIASVVLSWLFHSIGYDVPAIYAISSSSLGLLISFYTLYILFNRNKYTQAKLMFCAFMCFGSALAIEPIAIYGLTNTAPGQQWLMYLTSIAIFVAAATAFLSVIFRHSNDKKPETIPA